MNLTTQLKELIQKEKFLLTQILDLIHKIDSQKIWAKNNYPSLLKYLVYLGYSERQAYDRIQVTRLTHKVPLIKKKIQSGEINLTQASILQRNTKKLENSFST